VIVMNAGLPAVPWALVNVLLTATGLLLALRWMRQDAARQWRLGHPAQVRLMSGAVVAMLFSAALWANPYYTQCAEASGWLWWALGCFMLP
jgi:hypothetical protein